MNPSPTASSQPTVAVVGGGLAGLAAAVAAAGRGLRVELFEARRRLGGRAGAFRDPRTDTAVDFCQHVAMGCCTNLLDLLRRTGLADAWQRCTALNFVAPDGRMHRFTPNRWLPAPLHLLPALMRLSYLTRNERWHIAAALGRLAQLSPGSGSTDHETIGNWLRRHAQSQQMIDCFWSVVLQSALGETVDRASLSAARKVFVDGLLASHRAAELYVPQLPVGEMLHGRLKTWLAEHEVTLHWSTRIKEVGFDSGRATGLLLPDATHRPFDFVIVAVPWQQARSLFPPSIAAMMPVLEAAVGDLQPAPITAVHLWFDRQIMPLPHAVLVGRTSQWVFSPMRQDCVHGKPAWYCQVVISASHALVGRRPESVLGEVRQELESIWTDAGNACLLHWRVITHRAAVFSAAPGIDRLRPPQQTPIPNLMLAGDWTATGWPATMESAVRSGYLAIEAIFNALGRDDKLLVADLPHGWLVRLLHS